MPAVEARFLFPDLDTPALLVDLDVLERNLDRTAERARRHGVALRPHLKTHKSVELAREQLQRGAAGVTVAKVEEAEVFFAAGLRDICIAYPLFGEAKLRALRPLVEADAVAISVDSLEVATPLSELGRSAGHPVRLRLEVDVGMRRVGVPWGAQAAAMAVAFAQLPGVRFEGIACHAGHAHQVPPSQLPQAAAEEAQRMLATASAIRAAGVPCPVVSAGSTLTEPHLTKEQGITEVRPGTYVFNDVRTVCAGCCRWEDCAATVLATVVSRPEPGRAVIDAGSKTLTTAREEGHGHGVVLDLPGAQLERLSEEHGVIELSDPSVELRVGDRLRVIPVHVCVAVNMQHRLHGVRSGELERVFEVDAGLRSR